jgi:hypothetical protein
VEVAALAGIADRKSRRDKTTRSGELAFTSFYFPTRRHVTLAQRREPQKMLVAVAKRDRTVHFKFVLAGDAQLRLQKCEVVVARTLR